MLAWIAKINIFNNLIIYSSARFKSKPNHENGRENYFSKINGKTDELYAAVLTAYKTGCL